MVNVIVGLQCGNEGKDVALSLEKIDSEIVVSSSQYTEKWNYGYGKGKIKYFQILPRSITDYGVLNVLPSGKMIDVEKLVEEIKNLKMVGRDISKEKLVISEQAQVIMPFHIEMARIKNKTEGSVAERNMQEEFELAFQDRNSSIGICIGDLIGNTSDLLDKLNRMAQFYNKSLEKLGASPYTEGMISHILYQYVRYGEYLKPYINDTDQLLANASRNCKVVLEGSQSSFENNVRKSYDYPYNHSCKTAVAAMCAYAGVSYIRVHEIIGVMKAYCTRDGEGAFPTEVNSERFKGMIRKIEVDQRYHEDRRYGWLDLVMIKQAVKENNVSKLVLTNVHGISKLPEFMVCTAYSYHGKTIDYVPIHHEQCTPLYKTFKGGWNIEEVETFGECGKDAEEFVAYVMEYTGVPVYCLDAGPGSSGIMV